jgi:GNAT superfamily N-acetyltransferase
VFYTLRRAGAKGGKLSTDRGVVAGEGSGDAASQRRFDVAMPGSTLRSQKNKGRRVPIVYRPVCAHDLQRAGAFVVASINDLTQRHGFGSVAGVRPPAFLQFSFRDDPDGLWVAEEGGDMRGLAFGWACGDLWFLAQLFVAPGQQGNGIGQNLLTHALEHAQKSNAATRALITFAFNSVSQGLYMRNGMFPRCAIYDFAAARETLLPRLPVSPLRCVPVADTASDLRELVEVDARALGVSREKHHRFLIGDGARGALLYAGEDCVGYAYVSADGRVGPLAVTRQAVLADAFAAGLKLAAECGSAQVSAFIPGAGEAALSLAVKLGMRISLPMVLMSTRDFGDWGLYLPRNPGFM